jgi:hypothetical protein
VAVLLAVRDGRPANGPRHVLKTLVWRVPNSLIEAIHAVNSGLVDEGSGAASSGPEKLKFEDNVPYPQISGNTVLIAAPLRSIHLPTLVFS